MGCKPGGLCLERVGPPALPVLRTHGAATAVGLHLRVVGTFTYSVSTTAQSAFPGQKPGTKSGLNT